MAKMTKAERTECEKNLALCRSACMTFEKMLKDDDAEADKAVKASDSELIRAAIKRDGATAGFLMAREFGHKGGPAE